MKKYEFKSVEDFTYKLAQKYEHYEKQDNDFVGVSVVSHYSTMIGILNNLVKGYAFEMYDISISSTDSVRYADEWILTIDDEGKIWLHEAKYESGYIYDESNITFVHSDVNSAFIIKNQGQNMVEFDFINRDEIKIICDNYSSFQCNICEAKHDTHEDMAMIMRMFSYLADM